MLIHVIIITDVSVCSVVCDVGKVDLLKYNNFDIFCYDILCI